MTRPVTAAAVTVAMEAAVTDVARTGWDGALVNARLATLAGDAGYGVVDDGVLGWRDGMLVFAGARHELPASPDALATQVIDAAGEWVTPGQFLGAAERYGLLGAVDRWVIHHLLQWLAANPRHQRQLAQANVNLSASSLLDPEFHLWLQFLFYRQKY